MSDLNAFDAASCCGCGECVLILCALGCNETPVVPADWLIEEFVDGEYVPHSSGSLTVACNEVPPPPGIGGLVGGRQYRVTVAPTSPLSDYFGPATAEFFFECSVPYQIVNVQLEELEEGACACSPCGGLPNPTGDCPYEINGIPLLYNESTGLYEGCTLFTVESFPYCAVFDFVGGVCHICAAAKGNYQVPVRFLLSVPCDPDGEVDLLVQFPITCNYKRRRIGIFDPPTYVCSHLGAAVNTDPCYTFINPPGYGAYKCNAIPGGNPIQPLTTCDNTVEFLGGLSCAWLTSVMTGGSSATPACPADAECGARPTVDIGTMSVGFSWAIDCDAENPYEFEVTIDPDLWGDNCYCGNLGSSPGTPIVRRILEHFLNDGNVTIARNC